MKIKYSIKPFDGFIKGSFVRLSDELIKGKYSHCHNLYWRYGEFKDGYHYILSESGQVTSAFLLNGSVKDTKDLVYVSPKELKAMKFQKY